MESYSPSTKAAKPSPVVKSTRKPKSSRRSKHIRKAKDEQADQADGVETKKLEEPEKLAHSPKGTGSPTSQKAALVSIENGRAANEAANKLPPARMEENEQANGRSSVAATRAVNALGGSKTIRNTQPMAADTHNGAENDDLPVSQAIIPRLPDERSDATGENKSSADGGRQIVEPEKDKNEAGNRDLLNVGRHQEMHEDVHGEPEKLANCKYKTGYNERNLIGQKNRPVGEEANTLKPVTGVAPVHSCVGGEQRKAKDDNATYCTLTAPESSTANGQQVPALRNSPIPVHLAENIYKPGNVRPGHHSPLSAVAMPFQARGRLSTAATGSVVSRPTFAGTPVNTTGVDDGLERDHKPTAAEVAMERTALHSTIASFAALVALSLVLSLYMLTTRFMNPRDRPKDGLCTTVACRRHAHLVTTLVNDSIDPCDDLEAFACSKWAPQVATERGSPFGYGSALMALELADWFAEFKNELSSGAKHIVAGQQALAAFEACMADENPAGAAKRLDLLRQFMKDRRLMWPESPKEDVHPLGLLLDLAYNWRLGLWLEAWPEHREDSRKIGLLLTVGELVPFWSNYQDDIRRRNYEAYWKHFYAVFGGSSESIPSAKQINRVASVEAHVFDELMQVYQLEEKKPARIEIEKIGTYTQSISQQEWIEQLNTTLTAGQHNAYGPFVSLAVSDIALLVVISKLFGKYSHSELLQHISWFFVQVFAPLVTRELFLRVYGVKSAATLRRQIFCGTEVEAMFGSLVTSLNVVNRFDAKAREVIDKDISDVVFAAQDKISNLSSIDNITQSFITAKLAAMQTVLWPPADLDNETLTTMYANISMKGTFIELWIEGRKNLMRLVHSGTTYERALRLPRNFRLPFFTYDYLTNRVLVSLAGLGKEFFSLPPGTAAMRIGGLGFEYARQLVRAFDNIGLRVDSQGYIHNEPLGSLAPNPAGCAAQDADGVRELAALEVAYAAFERRARSSQLRTMKKYTEEEVFFITACLNLCRQPKTVPGVFASGCNAAAAKFAPFSQAFNCRGDANMSAARTCSYFQ